jgi:putative addiction module component (TIGR02574 family)
MIKAMLEAYQDDSTETSSLNEDQLDEIRPRKADHLKNKSKSYTWEQVKENARKAL